MLLGKDSRMTKICVTFRGKFSLPIIGEVYL
jgi:hypothetical protein